MTATLFPDLSPVAVRPPRSDRLILERYLRLAADDKRFDNGDIERSHQILLKWADLENSGRLAELHETQLQGDFLREVFGDALNYTRAVEHEDKWQLEQHWSIPGNGEPDAILGTFTQGTERKPVAVVELKGPAIHLDRERSAGRTAVQQCWDYLNNLPDTRWGIVSNMVSFRLYERRHTTRRFEHFSLQNLRDPKIFRQFYTLFECGGLLGTAIEPPRAGLLLEKTDNRQKTVGSELYERYSNHRLRLICHLHYDLGRELDDAIAIAQQLIDRIIFIAFCEDRELLPDRTLERAWSQLPPFTKATNPRWQNFKDLFRGVDSGSDRLGLEQGYNGGLFAPSDADELDLEDDWTDFFKEVGSYDFRDEINLDVLGHLFEKSITDLEKLREGDLFVRGEKLTGRKIIYSDRPTMPQSVLRKRMGIYYTPPEFTEKIVHLAVDELIAERFADAARSLELDPDTADTIEYWRSCLDVLRHLKICDPACGSGAFLFQAYEVLEQRYGEIVLGLTRHGADDDAEMEDQIPDMILRDNLYGVDLSREAVEITQLALWIRTARRGRTLADLSHNIHWGNSLIHEPGLADGAFDWKSTFPEVFDRDCAGFDCVIGNPPWERIKLQEREFFAISAPGIATAPNAAKRRTLIAALPKKNPELFQKYEEARGRAQIQLDYCRKSGEYPLVGRGDINTYAVFAELASTIVSATGRVGLLLPSGIASDKTTKDFFASLTDSQRLICLYDFENRKRLFADVDMRFKFSILIYGGTDTGEQSAKFVFFAHRIEDLEDRNRQIELSADDIALLNPNTRTCPIFRTKRDAELTRRMYRNIPILIDRDRKADGNPWGIRFMTMFHQTNDAECFKEIEYFIRNRYTLDGNWQVKGKKVYLPVYEAKMVQMYDHRAAGVVVDKSNWMRQGQTSATSYVNHQNPEYYVLPRYWAHEDVVANSFREEYEDDFLIGFKDITSPTNQRTMIASCIPYCGCTNHFVLIMSSRSVREKMCLLANLNSFIFDYATRQKIGGVTLNFFIVEQIPVLTPDVYERPCPWKSRPRKLIDWISDHVLKLSCTSEEMLGLSEQAGFSNGSIKSSDGKLNKWDKAKRAVLMAELDAAYFILYGIDRDDAEYIMSTFSGVFDSEPTLSGSISQGQLILEKYDEYSGIFA